MNRDAAGAPGADCLQALLPPERACHGRRGLAHQNACECWQNPCKVGWEPDLESVETISRDLVLCTDCERSTVSQETSQQSWTLGPWFAVCLGDSFRSKRQCPQGYSVAFISLSLKNCLCCETPALRRQHLCRNAGSPGFCRTVLPPPGPSLSLRAAHRVSVLGRARSPRCTHVPAAAASAARPAEGLLGAHSSLI